ALMRRSLSPRRCRCSGTMYVCVMGLSLLVTVIGISVLTVTQINTRITGANNDSAEAALLAQRPIKMAEVNLSTNSLWRTAYTSGTAITAVTLGHGTVSFELV